MPTPVREQALAAIKSALTTQLTGVAVYRNRSAKIVSIPAVNLIDGGMRPDDQTLGFTRYEMDFAIQGLVEASTDDELGPALSDLQARVVAVLLGNVTLNGTVIDIHEGGSSVEIDRGEGRGPNGMIETEFVCEFFTREGDPYTGGP